MSKFIFCFLGFFALQLLSAQVQSGSANYRVKMNEDAVEKLMNESSEKLAGFFKIQFAKRRKEVPYLDYKIYFNKKESLFKSIIAMKNDNGLDLERASRAVGAYGDFYVNLKEKIILNSIFYLDKYWLVQRYLNEIPWEITSETKIIKGYLCQKATAKYDPNFGKEGVITAWFAVSIPFQFGPMGYGGLPGLIIRLKQGFYTFDIDELKLSETKRKINRPHKGEPYDHKDFMTARKKREYMMKAQYVEQKKANR